MTDLLKYAAKLGVTAVIAIYLVYYMVTQQTKLLSEISKQLGSHQEQTADSLKEQQQTNENINTLIRLSAQDNSQLKSYMHQQLKVQLQACINSAKSQYQVNRCVDQVGTSFEALTQQRDGTTEYHSVTEVAK